MKKYGYVVLAAIAAALVSLAFSSSSAQAYPDTRIVLTVNHQVIYSGDSFTATGASTVPCSLDLEWNHTVRHGGATREFATTYVAPQVTKVTKIPLTAVCNVADGTAGRAASTTTAVHRSLTVTVLPRANGAAAGPAGARADLPRTGGPNRAWLVGGLVLLLAGATAVTVARRRAEEVELPGLTA